MLGIFPSQKIALMQLLTLRKLFTSLQDFNVGIFIDIFFDSKRSKNCISKLDNHSPTYQL